MEDDAEHRRVCDRVLQGPARSVNMGQVLGRMLRAVLGSNPPPPPLINSILFVFSTFISFDFCLMS